MHIDTYIYIIGTYSVQKYHQGLRFKRWDFSRSYRNLKTTAFFRPDRTNLFLFMVMRVGVYRPCLSDKWLLKVLRTDVSIHQTIIVRAILGYSWLIIWLISYDIDIVLYIQSCNNTAGCTWNVSCTEICGVSPTKNRRWWLYKRWQCCSWKVAINDVMATLRLRYDGGDGMSHIHPLTRSHCHTVTRTRGHSLGHSFIPSFVHTLLIHTFPRTCIRRGRLPTINVIDAEDSACWLMWVTNITACSQVTWSMSLVVDCYRPPCHTLTCSTLKIMHVDWMGVPNIATCNQVAYVMLPVLSVWLTPKVAYVIEPLAAHQRVRRCCCSRSCCLI